jgi:uroporphyrinogen-III synthase
VTDAPCHLGGISVLVTRPERQADGLCEAIAAAHGRPVRFPTLEILGPADTLGVRSRLATIAGDDILVFVSVNAVHYAFPLLPDQLPLDLAVAAVGSATGEALGECGLEPTLVPERMDSEGLLALPGLQAVAGRRVLLVCGNGGRDLIEQTLAERGARVERVEVYRRQRPERLAAARNLVAGWDRLVDVVTASSNAILDNLFEMVGPAGAELVRATPLVVISERMAAFAHTRGCRHVLVAESPRDEAVLAAVCQIAGVSAD